MRKLLGLIVITAGWALAQGPGFFPWWDSPLVRDLNLSEDQRTQIRATVRGHRDQLIEQRAELQKAEANLQDLMDEDQVDEGRATEAIEKVVTARSALARTFSMMSLKLRMLLSPKQWRELQQRQMKRRMSPRRRPGGRMRRRPGSAPQPPQPPEPPAPDAGLEL
jgi:Spy/CpxP family protein refolding chaperone